MTNVRVILRNPINYKDQIDYIIEPHDSKLSRDWLQSLKNDIIIPQLHLEKNYCFHGFPHTHRNLDYLCNELNQCVEIINKFNETDIWQNNGLDSYIIEEWFSPDSVRFNQNYQIGEVNEQEHSAKKLGLRIKHNIMNQLHNHFERLQGTVWKPSDYYRLASIEVKYAIRQLNNICHEIESLILSQRKIAYLPEWVRPSQITTFFKAPRHTLTDEHRQLFSNGYDRRFGEVYMHWCQIGKTLMEVYRDEGAPKLNVGNDPTDISIGSGTTCEAINSLKYYSGEFDIEWANDVVYEKHPWHTSDIDNFYQWLTDNGIDYTDTRLSLGYLPIAQVDLKSSFGSENSQEIWKILGDHLDIFAIEIDDVRAEYNYCWSDSNFKKLQLEKLKE